MKPFVILPLALVLASCRDENPAAKKPATRVVPEAPTSVLVSALRPPILDTAHIKILSSGEILPMPGEIGEEAEATLVEIRKLPASSLRDGAISVLIRQVAKENAGQARSLLRNWSDGLAFQWREAACSVGAEIAKSDPGSLVDFIDGDIPPAMKTLVWAASLMVIPPAERASYLEHIAESQDKIAIMRNMMMDWIHEDPESTSAWLDGFAEDRSADEIALLGNSQDRFSYLHDQPPQEAPAENWLAALRCAERPEVRALLARQALDRAGDNPSPVLLEELSAANPELAALVRHNAIQRDPETFIADLDAAEITALAPDVAEELIETWAKKQPRRAFDWAMEHSRPEAATAVLALYYLDPKEAAELAPTLREGKARDAAMRSMCALSASAGDAETAHALLPLITDPKQREASGKIVELHLADRPERAAK